jgi:hypothetical protein
MRETGTVLVERAGRGIAIVRLNRPAKLNAAPSLELALEREARGQAYATRGADFPAALAGIRTQVRG